MVEWWNGGMVEMVEWRNGGMVQWWNGGISKRSNLKKGPGNITGRPPSVSTYIIHKTLLMCLGITSRWG